MAYLGDIGAMLYREPVQPPQAPSWLSQLAGALGQTWPARMAKDAFAAAQHPGNVYAGTANPYDTEKALGLAGLMMGGGFGGAPRGALGSGPFRHLTETEAKAAYEAGTVPEGWMVHGRTAAQQGAADPLDTGYALQLSRRPEVAESYAGNQGSVWYVRPKEDATVLDLTHDRSPGLAALARAFRQDFHAGTLPGDIVGALTSDTRPLEAWRSIKGSFVPRSIVDSAGAFDNPDWASWVWDKTGAGYVRTPDGGVVLDLPQTLRVRAR